MKVPFFTTEYMHAPIRDELLEAIHRVYESGWYILGKEVEEFEKEFAEYTGTDHCVGVSNGLDGLRLCLRALDLPEGSEVIVASNAYIACWNAIALEGLNIFPVEPDPRTFNLDPFQLERAITDHTRAIMPVHLFGQACDMPLIMELAEKHDLIVIEDHAQSHGAEIQGRKAGSFGHLNATSFYPTKNLGALGDGGAITTDDPDFAAKIRQLRNYGSREKYFNDFIGVNARLDELQAAVLRVKLRHLDEWNAHRRSVAAFYDEQFEALSEITRPHVMDQSKHSYHIYAIRYEERDALMEYLHNRGIGTLIHYPVPPHLQEAYDHLGYQAGAFPIAEELVDTSLSLPIYPGVDAEAVSEAVNAFFKT